MAVLHCLVFVPAGWESHVYEADAKSNFAAAWDAIQQHEKLVGVLSDDDLVRVLIDEQHVFDWAPMDPDFLKLHPNFLHIVGRVRAWAGMAKTA